MTDNEKTTDDPWFSTLLDQSQRVSDEDRLALWQQATSQHPQSGLPWLMLGAEHAQRGANADAEEAYARALTLAPALHIARFQLGLLQFCEQRVGAAMLTWQGLAALNEDDPLRLFAEGFTALGANQAKVALDRFQRGLMANESNPVLNKDMQAVVERIHALDQDPAHTPADYHFLLANYREAGKLH